MNRRMIVYTVGMMIVVEAIALCLPAAVSLIYNEKSFWAFLITMCIALILGSLFILISRKPVKTIYAKEGFLIVALSWIFASLVGSLPFILSNEIPNFFDAFFETVSGFTTTGASVLSNVEGLSRGMLFWRSFTHYIGGIGVLVFVVALIPNISGRTIYILRAEMPGPTFGKLSPRMKDTVKMLCYIYFALTAVEIILLVLGDMPLYDSIIHTFGTAGTGGFGIKNNSLTGYNAYCQWVITVFMFLFAINFNIYYLIIMKRISSIFKNNELWLYVGIVLTSVALITGNLISVYNNIPDALRHSAFQVSSIISTTGFSTADFNAWPTLSKTVLFILMFIGGCAGSTCGGLKVSRFVILVKLIRAELNRMLHPRAISTIKVDGKPLDNKVEKSVLIYFALYCACLVMCFVLISFNGYDIVTNLSATVACFNNVGPGFELVGPLNNYGIFSAFSKVVLSFAMLLGRLEIFPLLLCFTPSTWIRK